MNFYLHSAKSQLKASKTVLYNQREKEIIMIKKKNVILHLTHSWTTTRLILKGSRKNIQMLQFFFGNPHFFFHRPPPHSTCEPVQTQTTAAALTDVHTWLVTCSTCQFPVHSADLPLVPLAMHLYHYAFITSGLGTNCGNLRLVLTQHQWTQEGYWDLSVCTFLPCVFVILFCVNH